jgi:hypothetical protein
MRLLNISLGFIICLNLSLLSQENSLQKPTVNESKYFANIPKEILSSCSQFFKLLNSSDVDLAYDNILKNSPIAKKEEQVKNLKEETLKSFKLYGKLESFEPVNSETVSESLIRVRYISIHADYPMRWIFTFYKSPPRGWIVINIKFDDLTEYFFSDQ